MQMMRALSAVLLVLFLVGCAVTPEGRAPTPLSDREHLRTLVEGVQLNETLNPKLWQGDRIDPVVRERLLLMADQFIKDIGFKEVKVKEITFAGSNVGYLYHDKSDVDVHITVDGSALSGNLGFLFKLFNAVSDDWNGDFDFSIRGYGVELFMLDHRRKEGSAGVYSLERDEWISKPEKPTNIVDSDVVLNDVIRFADEFETVRAKYLASPDTFDCTEFERYRKKLKTYRAVEGFDRTGEYSVGNLGYKALRNGGYLDVSKAEMARCLAQKFNLE